MVGFMGGMAGGAAVTIVVSAIDKASGVFKNVNKTMLLTGAALAALGVAGIAAMGKLVSATSDLQESVNAVNVVFGEASDEILKIGESSAKAFGMSRNEFNASAVRFSAFANVIATDGQTVSSIIKDMTTRTADFASVMNIDVGMAQTLMSAGLAGETEGLRRYGIDVSAATVKTFAYANGIAEAGSELTEQQKIIARYQLIMQQTDKTAGDFANTSDSLANRQRILKASMTDLRAELGEALLPVFETVIGWVQKAVDVFQALPGPVKAGIAILAGLTAVLLVLGGVILMLTAVTAAFTAVNIWWIAIVVAVIAIIALLVAAGVWLVKHWDTVKNAAGKLGVFLQNVFISVANVVLTVWNKIIDIIEFSINQVIKAINKLISAYNAVAKKLGLGTISQLGMLDLSRFQAEMIEKKTFTPSAPTSTGEAESGLAGIVSKATGVSSGAGVIAPAVVDTAVSNDKIASASESSSVSLGQLETINTRIAMGVEDLVILGKIQAQKGFNVHIENINGLTGRDLANALQIELDKQISR